MYPSRGGRGKPHFLSIHTTRFRRLGTNRNPVTEAVSLESYLLYAVSVNNRIVCANNLRIYHCEVLVSRPQTFGRTLKAYGHTAKGAVKLTSSIGSRCLRKKHGLVNRHGDTLAFLKGWTLVIRELLTNKVNQLRRGINTLENDTDFLLVRAFDGATSITETGTESFPIVEILILLGVKELFVKFTYLFLKARRVLIVGEK